MYGKLNSEQNLIINLSRHVIKNQSHLAYNIK